MAQNLDRFRTFPRLAGGKGPSPALAVVEEEAAEGLPPELGGSAGAEHSSWNPRPGRARGLFRALLAQSAHFFSIPHAARKLLLVQRHFLESGDARVMRAGDPAVSSFCSSGGRRAVNSGIDDGRGVRRAVAH